MGRLNPFLNSARILFANKKAFWIAAIALTFVFLGVSSGPFLQEAGREKIMEINSVAKDNEMYVRCYSKSAFDLAKSVMVDGNEVVSSSVNASMGNDDAFVLGNATTSANLCCYEERDTMRFVTQISFLTDDFSGVILTRDMASKLATYENYQPYNENGEPNPEPKPVAPETLLGRTVIFKTENADISFPITNIYDVPQDHSLFSALGGNSFNRNSDAYYSFAPFSLIGANPDAADFGGIRLVFQSSLTRSQVKSVCENLGYGDDENAMSHVSAPFLDTETVLGNYAVLSIAFRTSSFFMALIGWLFATAVLFLERRRYASAYHIYWLNGASKPKLFGFEAYHASIIFAVPLLISLSAFSVISAIILAWGEVAKWIGPYMFGMAFIGLAALILYVFYLFYLLSILNFNKATISNR